MQLCGSWTADTMKLPLYKCGEIAKVLLIKPSSLGDIIHALPVLNMLHARFPRAEIDWVVAKGFHGILEDHPLIHRLWIIDKNSWKNPRKCAATFAELKALRSGLKREKFDLVIDLQGLLRSGIIGLFTGTKDRVGFCDAREGAKYTYSHRVPATWDEHAVERNIRIALALGCNMDDLSFPFPSLDLREEIARRLPPRFAVIAPSAGTLVKRWPAENFGELASRLSLPSVVVGSVSDRSQAAEIVEKSNGRALSLAGQISLRELAAVISRARFLLSPDTGPMHIAAALDIPVFALFGPTNPDRTGPFGNIHTVIRNEMACSPCYKRKPCPDWRCITGITPEMVLEIINRSDYV